MRQEKTPYKSLIYKRLFAGPLAPEASALSAELQDIEIKWFKAAKKSRRGDSLNFYTGTTAGTLSLSDHQEY